MVSKSALRWPSNALFSHGNMENPQYDKYEEYDACSNKRI